MRNGSSSSVELRLLTAVVAVVVAAPLSAQPGGLIAPLSADAPIGYHIQAASDAPGYRASDSELCGWAIVDWAAHAEQGFELVPADEAEALIKRVVDQDDPFEQSEILRGIDRSLSGEGAYDKLADAGFGDPNRVTADAVLNRLKASK